MRSVPDQITALAEERQVARANKDFARSDELREQILQSGWLIKDTSEGYVLT
jgi:cysteinyl-tRNA synthetase